MLKMFLRNKTFLDIMSINHFFSGFFLGLFLFFLKKNKKYKFFKKKQTKKQYFIFGIIYLIIWELFEAILRIINIYYPLFLKRIKFIPLSWANHESIVNILGDMVSGILGLLIIYLVFKYFKVIKNEKYETNK